MNAPNDIKVFVFDLGNVLLPFDWRKSCRAFSEYGEKAYKGMAKIITETALFVEFEKGLIPNEDFYTEAKKIMDIDIGYEDFNRIFCDIFSTNDSLIKLLPEIAENYKLILLSNINAMHAEWVRRNTTFLESFHHVVMSYQVNAVKPEGRIFEEVLKRSGESPESHIYIDDIEDYVKKGSEIGFKTIHHLSEGKTIAEIKRNGLIKYS